MPPACRATIRVLAWFVVVLAPQTVLGQTEAAPPGRERLLAGARVMVEKAPFATLITLGADGYPQARVVDPFAPDSSFVVWIGTNPRTRKVNQIREDPHVTVSYSDPGGTGYVTVFGLATIVSDPEIRSRHFKDGWRVFYPDGPLGADFVLIRVDPVRIEVLDLEAGLTGDPDTWAPFGIDL